MLLEIGSPIAPGPVEHEHGSPSAREVCRWLAEQGAATAFIEPGAPWQNAYIESYHSRLCDELLGGQLFYSPQRALGNRTPNEFAAASVPDGDSATPLRWPGLTATNHQLIT